MLLLLAVPGTAVEDEAEPQMSDVRQFTCPVGGARFSQEVGFWVFPFVSFPDGSYLGDDKIDAEIPVCPDNGLVILPDPEATEAAGADRMLYGTYSAAELAQLPALIADPAYQGLAPEGRHAQAYWLATRLGRPARLRFMLLQRATWAATDPVLRRRLVERLVAEGPALIDAAGLPDFTRRSYLYYIVNALRELGRFDEALTLLETIESQPGPRVAAPRDPDETAGPPPYAPLMRGLIADKDTDRFPVHLMASKWADFVCKGNEELQPPYGPRTAAIRAGCARSEAARKREEAEAAIAERESDRLLKDRAALDRACAATPEARRSAGLAMACEQVADERDTAAGEALAKDGPALAAACEATPPDQQSGALRHGCDTYDTALSSALKGPLTEDDAAYAILCAEDQHRQLVGRDLAIFAACQEAAILRQDMVIDHLLADPVALDARCAATKGDQDDDLATACSQRARKLEQAERERIAGDDRAFEEKCGRFRRQLSRPEDIATVLSESDELTSCRDLQDLRARGPSRAAPDETPADANRAETSLMIEARARAAALIAKAKAEGTYPKRRPAEGP